MLTIKVLGPGCENCKNVEAIARNVVTSLGLDAQVEKITRYDDIKKYPILATPGLVINEKLVYSGKIPAPSWVVKWINEAQAA